MAVQPSDRDLLLAWRGGDRSRGSELFSRHAASIMRFFRNKVAGAAEELTQQTFLALVESIDRYRAESSFRGYLFGVARNQLLMHLRRRGSDRERFDPSTWSVVDAGAAPDRIAARHEEHTLLLAALQRIPVDMQIVFELHYWEGLSVNEIADAMDTAPGTIKARLARGRARLREQLDALEADASVLASTVDNLDRWASTLPSVTVAHEA
jgi:RNA polymerase sigma factor (sigma-70 family)